MFLDGRNAIDISVARERFPLRAENAGSNLYTHFHQGAVALHAVEYDVIVTFGVNYERFNQANDFDADQNAIELSFADFSIPQRTQTNQGDIQSYRAFHCVPPFR